MNRKPMSQGQRLLFYIVLNVIISACTILSVLWIWDRAKDSPDLSSANQVLATLIHRDTTPASPTPTPAVQLTGGELPELIRVDNVFGIGNLPDEVVLLKRTGEGELVLTGWKLQDDQGAAFTFPALTLYKDGAVQVHTTAGVNSVVDLYWGRDTAAWETGEQVTLLDAAGNVRATYTIQ